MNYIFKWYTPYAFLQLSQGKYLYTQRKESNCYSERYNDEYMTGSRRTRKTGAIVYRLFFQTLHNFIELLILKFILKDDKKIFNVFKGCNSQMPPKENGDFITSLLPCKANDIPFPHWRVIPLPPSEITHNEPVRCLSPNPCDIRNPCMRAACNRPSSIRCGIALDAWMFPVGDEVYSRIPQPLFFINSERFQYPSNIIRMKKCFLPDRERKMITIRWVSVSDITSSETETWNWDTQSMNITE